MYPLPLFLLGAALVTAHYIARIWAPKPDRKFPPVTKDHHVDDLDRSKVVPYSKFRARRLIQEKELKKAS